MWFRVVLTMASLLPLPSDAGPWLREDGSLFLSFGQNLALTEGTRLPVNQDPNLYVEWGATEKMTLSFSAFSGDAGRETTVEAKLTRALSLPWQRESDALSYSLGVGARHIDGISGIEPLMLAGLAWGRGLESGWIVAETQLAHNPQTGGTEGKFDLTWGHHFSDRISGYLLLTAGEGHTGDRYAKLSPNAIIRLGDTTRLSLGLTHALTGDRGTGLSLATWLEF